MGDRGADATHGRLPRRDRLCHFRDGARPITLREATPRLEHGLAGRTDRSRDAFLLSLVDGELSLQSIVDASGMREDQVIAILDRLSEAGILKMS